MKLIKLRLIAVVVAVSALAVNVSAKPVHKKPAAHKPAKKAALPADTSDSAWTPDPKLLSQLQPEQHFGPYAMRVPVGFIITSHDHTSNKGLSAIYEMRGPARKDHTYPLVYLLVVSALPGVGVTRTVGQLLDYDKYIPSESGVVKSDIEYSDMGNLSAARQYYKCPLEKDKSLLAHGFHYGTTQITTAALAGAIDVAPYNTDTLPLCEAAIRTLRKLP